MGKKKTVRDLKMEIKAIKRTQMEATQGMENLGKRTGTTDANITTKIQEMEERISGIGDNIEEMDISIKENVKCKKFLTQLENIILSEVTQSQKEHTWYALTNKWILAQKFGIPKVQFTDHMKLKKKGDQSVDTFVLLRRVIKISMGGERDKVWSRNRRKGHPVTVTTVDIAHIQLSNPDTIVDANKCFLTEA
jgi:seryl-tRNA synthetase